MGNSLDVTTPEMDQEMVQNIDIGPPGFFDFDWGEYAVYEQYTIDNPQTEVGGRKVLGYSVLGKPRFRMRDFRPLDTYFDYPLQHLPSRAQKKRTPDLHLIKGRWKKSGHIIIIKDASKIRRQFPDWKPVFKCDPRYDPDHDE